MNIIHESAFVSVMNDLEFLGYEVNVIKPNSHYSLKDIMLELVTEYRLAAYEDGLADGHGDGYDLAEEQAAEEYQHAHSRGYEEGYEAGEEDADAVNQDEAYERGFDDGVYETRHGVDH